MLKKSVCMMFLRLKFFKNTFAKSRTRILIKLLLVPLPVLILCNCNNSPLYSNLNEKEANEMQSILLRQGIDCDKLAGNENTWVLSVSKNNVAEAVEILKSFGYPKDQFADMGEMFKKEGLVSSPLEERIRYIFALSQEVAETISKIDGVITARVHIVLPENDPLSEYFQPSSASVFVKHRQTLDIQKYIHQIRQLVVNSIEGLSYEKVTVVPFASSVVFAAPRQYTRIMGIEIVTAYKGRFIYLVSGLSFFLILLLGVCLFLLYKTNKQDSPTKKETKKEDKQLEFFN